MLEAGEYDPLQGVSADKKWEIRTAYFTALSKSLKGTLTEGEEDLLKDYSDEDKEQIRSELKRRGFDA
jgi:hypothetical protein